MSMSAAPSPAASITDVKSQIIEAGSRFVQSFGFNRVAGQVLVSLYLTDGIASLDALEGQLHLSKAAVSLACTQLERLGLIRRERRVGDRKRYYRSAEDIGTALRHGILKFARSKMIELETDLKQVDVLLDLDAHPDATFLAGRLARMHKLSARVTKLLDNPLLKLFSKLD